MATRGLILPMWMRAAWFKKHGYRALTRLGYDAVTLGSHFTPKHSRRNGYCRGKQPSLKPGYVMVTAFINGWCPAMNITVERARRAAGSIWRPCDI